MLKKVVDKVKNRWTMRNYPEYEYELLRYSWEHWNMGKYVYTTNEEMMEEHEIKLSQILQPSKPDNIYIKNQRLIGFEENNIDALNKRLYDKIYGTKKMGIIKGENQTVGVKGGFPMNIGENFKVLIKSQKYKIYYFWFSLLKPAYKKVFIEEYKRYNSSRMKSKANRKLHTSKTSKTGKNNNSKTSKISHLSISHEEGI
jgi:hypothetical protein